MGGGTDKAAGFSGIVGLSSGQQQFPRAGPMPGRLPTCPQPQQHPPATEAETAAQKSATYAKARRPAPAAWNEETD